jgi:hypothetical protein
VQRGGNFATDAAARSYIEAVRVADGGQYMEPAVQRAIDAFIIGLKADSIFTPIKAACILMGARTLAGALTPLVGGAPTNVNNNFVSGDYDRKRLAGNGSTKYLDINRANDADGRDDYHLSVFIETVQTGSNTFYAGSANATAGTSQIGFSGSAPGGSCRTQSLRAAGTSAVGFLGVSRSVSTGYAMRNGGSSYPQTQLATAPSSDPTYVFARFQSGSANGISNGRLQWYSTGSSIDLALLEARLKTLSDAIEAAIP